MANTELDFFLILSSSAGIIGSHGQSAYAAINTFLDVFASYRKGLGLLAASIDIGSVAGVSYAAEHKVRQAAEMDDTLSEDELLAVVRAHIIGEYSGDEER